MIKSLYLSLLLMICGTQVVAQKTFKLKKYIPNEIGYEWQFKNNVKDGMSPIVVKNAETIEFAKVSATKRTENNGDHRLQNITKKGLEVYQLYFIGNRFIEYEKSVLLMPNKLKIGDVYKSETRYKTLVNSELKEQGSQTYEVKVERIEDV